MRILHICSGNLYGGVETIQTTLARYRGECPEMEPHFSVCFEGRLSQELRALDVPVYNLGAVRVRNPISLWAARTRLRELLSSSRYDAAICHSAWTQAIFGPIVQSARVPSLFWLHGAPSGHHWLERWAKRTRPEKVICCSQFTAGLLWKLYPDVPKQVVYAPVPPGVEQPDSRQRFDIREKLGTAGDAVVIIQVSRMEALKGHKVHLEALGMLKDIPNWVCWMVGGAQRKEEVDYARNLKSLATKHGIGDRVKFLGERLDVARLLGAADLFCQPNVDVDAFPIAFIEALLAGLPVVTSAIGGGKEIVNRSCGATVPSGDSKALAAMLRQLVANSDLRQRISAAAPTRGHELCEPTQQLKRLFGLIEKTVAPRRVG